MNTAKQVNVMVGLLMVFAVGTLLYFLWDDNRASEATERQLVTNAERGGALYALNCRACHGLFGKGVLESSVLPGAPLNTDDPYRLQDASLSARQQRYRDTIKCGRIGTVMPPWHQDYGGPLNDYQIQQLITLITSTASEKGWEWAVERANHTDEFSPAKHLVEAVSAEDTTLVLDNPLGLKPGNLLRLDEKPDDEVYEVVSVVDAPASSTLTEDASKDATELSLQEAAVFHPGDIIVVGNETMEVVAAPASTTLAEDLAADATTIVVTDAESLASGDVIKIAGEKMGVTSVSGNTIRVQRGVEDTKAIQHPAGAAVTEQGNLIQVKRAQEGTAATSHRVKSTVFEVGDTIVVERAAHGTKAAEHPADTEVFNGPILPGTSITGDPAALGFPPCGQRAAAPPGTPAPVQAISITGTVDMVMGDNFFELQGAQNPTLQMSVGDTVTINLKNNGAAIHNFRTTGADGVYQNADDHVSVPLTINGGATGTVQIKFDAAGTYKYQCDFHPTQMLGEIIVQ